MKKIFFTVAIFVTLLFSLSSCMSTRYLGYESPGGTDHSNHGGSNYSSSGGGAHSGGCH